MPGPFIQDRDDSRRFFLSVWEKYQKGAVLEPLEDMILKVILEHPEYHMFMQSGITAADQEFPPEAGATNPFLHMGMHIAIREQISTDRPPGVSRIHQQLAKKLGSTHEAEHLMFECLGEILWTAQRNNTLPDETDYLEKIKGLL